MNPHDEIDPKTAHDRLSSEPGAVYLDVRTTGEYDQGHPSGAWSMPILLSGMMGMKPNPDFQPVAAAVLPKDTLIVVGCRSGQRSAMACDVLHQLGYSRAVNMAGGFMGASDP